ncbi:hypothetical protein AB0I68_18755 [Streptomyces sp. NPDC050448]|uniref:hypothetical protein n=1 Tax=Streptomyces sp. NPDC050448 TaxID=3155404 RepID=UPI00341D4ADB
MPDEAAGVLDQPPSVVGAVEAGPDPLCGGDPACEAPLFVQATAVQAKTLSFLDVRVPVAGPLRIMVETVTPDDSAATAVYERGTARLIAHEIDHLDGLKRVAEGWVAGISCICMGC